jgi:glutathione S-transferase
MHYELVSFRICPFVQRARIVLLHKRVEHTVTYIDLKSPPAWFEAISPLGKVPLLRVDGDTVLFESTVINEFIDETTPPALMPVDPLVRARHRAWIAFAGELQLELGRFAMAPDADSFAQAHAGLRDKLARIEAELGAGPYFAVDRFTLVDATFAPFWMRLQLLESAAPLGLLEATPRCAAWSDGLLALPEVSGSVDDDFPARFGAHVAASGGYGAARYAPRLRLDRAAS